MAEVVRRTVRIAADPVLLASGVSTLLGVQDGDKGSRYLNMECGTVCASELLLTATCTQFLAGGHPAAAAQKALSEASETTATHLLQFAYGGSPQLTEDSQLLELWLLAKSVGMEACVDACRMLIGKSKDIELPISLTPRADDVKQVRDQLRSFRSGNRFVDTSLHVQTPTTGVEEAGSRSDQAKVAVAAHRCVLAAACDYFAALWGHHFKEAHSDSLVIEVEAASHILKFFVEIIYGEEVEVKFPDDVLQLLLLADKWQAPAVTTACLVHLESALTRKDAMQLLETESQYPQSVVSVALTVIGNAVRQNPKFGVLLDRILDQKPHFVAELLNSEAKNLPNGLYGRLALLVAGKPGLGMISMPSLKPRAVAEILKAHCSPNEFWWDVSEWAFSEKFNVGLDQYQSSARFECGGVLFRLRFYPSGVRVMARFGEQSCSLFLCASKACKVEGTLHVDDETYSIDRTFEPNLASGRGEERFCRTKLHYTRVGVHFDKVIVGSQVCQMPDNEVLVDALMQWSSGAQDEVRHRPLLELYDACLPAGLSPTRVALEQTCDKRLKLIHRVLSKITCGAEYCLHNLHDENLPANSYGKSVANHLRIVWITSHLEEVMQCPAWLALNVDVAALVVGHVADYANPIVLNGIAAWARKNDKNLEESLQCIKDLFSRLTMSDRNQASSFFSHSVANLLNSFELQTEAFPFAEGIMKKSANVKAGNVSTEDADGKDHCNEASRKRKHDLDGDILHGVAAWGMPHLKRLRSSDHWADLDPATLALFLREQPSEDVEDQRTEAAMSWARPAKLTSVLQAVSSIGVSSSAGVSDALLQSARQKAASLEQQIVSLGGDGLQQALDAAHQARTEANAAEVRAASAEKNAESLARELAEAQAEVLSVRKDLENQRLAHRKAERMLFDSMKSIFPDTANSAAEDSSTGGV